MVVVLFLAAEPAREETDRVHCLFQVPVTRKTNIFLQVAKDEVLYFERQEDNPFIAQAKDS